MGRENNRREKREKRGGCTQTISQHGQAVHDLAVAQATSGGRRRPLLAGDCAGQLEEESEEGSGCCVMVKVWIWVELMKLEVVEELGRGDGEDDVGGGVCGGECGGCMWRFCGGR